MYVTAGGDIGDVQVRGLTDGVAGRVILLAESCEARAESPEMASGVGEGRPAIVAEATDAGWGAR